MSWGSAADAPGPGPTSLGAMSAALQELARIGRQMNELDSTADAAGIVANAAAACAEHVITFALVGEYNSGKSSLLNLFLGRPVVPVGRFPETGAVCNVRRGAKNAASGRWATSAHPIGATLDELRAAISITRGGRRTEAQLPDCVEITADDLDIPDDVVFTDTPGVNDDRRMTRLAFDAAVNADVLIWVLQSRQYLSIEEAKLLRELAANGSPLTCLFVVNMFLEEESPAAWTTRCEEDEPHYRSKLSALVRELDLDVAEENRRPSDDCSPLFVSARAGRRDLDVFGGAAFRLAIERIVNGTRQELLGKRQRRIVRTCLHDLTERATPRAKLARAEYEQSREAHAAYRARVEARNKFRSAVGNDVAAAIAELKSGAAAAAASINAKVSSQDLKRDASYQTDLNQRLRVLGRRVADELASQVARTARAYEQKAPARRVAKELRKLFTPPDSVIDVPNASVDADGPAGGAVAGAIAGSIVPGIGTLFGAIAGGIIGLVASSNGAQEKDVKGVKGSITSASTSATRPIVRRKRRMITVCERKAISSPIEPASAPDARPTEAWQAIVSAIDDAKRLCSGRSSQ